VVLCMLAGKRACLFVCTVLVSAKKQAVQTVQLHECIAWEVAAWLTRTCPAAAG
jgi:hypothetical protein